MLRKYSERPAWSALPTRERCAVMAAVAAEIAAASAELVRRCRSEQRYDDVETVASELLPLCAALRFLRRRGPSILRPRRRGRRGRPAWMWGVHHTIHRVPLGDVLILGTWNYPLLLPGVQAAQALAAGNAVLLKPAEGTEEATAMLADCFYRGGVPRAALQVLDSAPRAAIDAIDRGVDLIVLTGSAATGRKVLAQAAEKLTPTIMELSGCDAVIALPSADPERLVAAIDFGLCFNSGATCIGPRRLIISDTAAEPILRRLDQQLAARPAQVVHPVARAEAADRVDAAIAAGAVDRGGRYDSAQLRRSGLLAPLVLDQVDPHDPIASADLFAPVMSVIRVKSGAGPEFASGVESAGEAEFAQQGVDLVNGCAYRLAASVFGAAEQATSLAAALQVGTVTINDLVAPTADPRVPFGGRGASGYGVTRGEEGLLAMTAIQVISERRGRIAPHLSSRKQSDTNTLLGYLRLTHGGSLASRLAGLRQMLAGRRE